MQLPLYLYKYVNVKNILIRRTIQMYKVVCTRKLMIECLTKIFQYSMSQIELQFPP